MDTQGKITRQLKSFSAFARCEMEKQNMNSEKMREAFCVALMNSYAKFCGVDFSFGDDSAVPNAIKDKFSLDIMSGEFVCVETIGRIYQYFILSDRESAIDVIKGKDIDKNISFATQVFTPKWLSQYLVENSLGRFYSEINPDNCIDFKYLIKPKQSRKKEMDLSKITFFDPCCGSGIFLSSAFDLYMKMYENEGINPGDAILHIINENIFGADIDYIAIKMSLFSLMMKAYEYDKNVDFSKLRPNLYLLNDKDSLGSLSHEGYISDKSFTIVATNPPYSTRIGGNLRKYLNENMKDYSKDLFSAFMYKGIKYTEKDGYMAYLTPNVWMFLSSHKKLREYILKEKSIINLIQFSKGSFFSEASVDLCAFVIQNSLSDEKGIYIKSDENKVLNEQKHYISQIVKNINEGKSLSNVYRVRGKDFFDLPCSVMSFYTSDNVKRLFKEKKIEDFYIVKQGMTTGDNNRFVKFWFEVPYSEIGFNMKSSIDAKNSGKKYFPYNKGGKYRKWYGNNQYVVMYQDDGKEIKDYTSTLAQGTWVRVKSREYYFKSSVTWSFISSSHFGVRYCDGGSIFDVAGSSLFGENLFYVLGFLCSKSAFYLLQLINPTMNYQVRDIKRLPLIIDKKNCDKVEENVKCAIEISRENWDESEVSWNFKSNPIIKYLHGEKKPLKKCVNLYLEKCKSQRQKLKELEDENNAYFAKLYGLEDETNYDDPITLFDYDECDAVMSVISFFVGCFFKRFSMDEDGIIITSKKTAKIADIANFVDESIKKYFDNNSLSYALDTICQKSTQDFLSKEFLKYSNKIYFGKSIYQKSGDSIIYFNMTGES